MDIYKITKGVLNMATNITKAYLLHVPNEKDYAHTLYFSTASEQQAYFMARKKFESTDLSYQRKDGVLRFPAQMDSILDKGCNYVMYQNSAYSNRWFYAFITGMSFENPQHTNITIATDCIQTWMFDITIKPSFVEREHAASDEIGEHTIDEMLETGEHIINSVKNLSIDAGNAIVAAVTELPDGTKAPGGLYHGMYSGLSYIPFRANGEGIADFINSYDKEAAADAIVMMFLAPQVLLIDDDGLFTFEHPIGNRAKPYTLIINKPSNDFNSYDHEVNDSFTDGNIDGYTPRNKKLLSYPYRYILASNNAGASAIYKYERFFIETENGDRTIIQPSFLLAGCLTPGCSIRLIPIRYNGTRENHEEGINMGKYPTLNWTSDAYTNWLTQNAVNIGLQIASGVGQVVAGAGLIAGTGALGVAVGGGQIVGGVSAIAGTLAQVHQQSLVPPQAKGNTNSGDIITAMRDNEFKFYNMSIKAEYAKAIDDYFDMYGYKCNRVKIPEKEHRKAFWFTKTIDAAIEGPIPQEDIQVIKDAYNKGITFWRHTANFIDYSQDNSIV